MDGDCMRNDWSISRWVRSGWRRSLYLAGSIVGYCGNVLSYILTDRLVYFQQAIKGMIEISIAVLAACISIVTAVFGYLKLVRNDRVSSIEEQIDLWKTRVLLLEEENRKCESRCSKLEEKVVDLQNERDKLSREQIGLLMEIRELKGG
jgi:hypothetical protein